MTEGLAYACLTHSPLWVDDPAYVTPIYSGRRSTWMP